MSKEITILPHCIGTKSMDKKEVRFCWFMNFRYPTMHSGAIFKICCYGTKPRKGKEISVKTISGCCEAKAFGHCVYSMAPISDRNFFKSLKFFSSSS